MLSYKSEMEFEARKDFNVDKVKFYECVKKKRTNVYSHELSYFYIHLQLEIILDKYAMKLIFCFAWYFLFTRMTPHNCKLKLSNIANCKSSCWTHYLCLHIGDAIWFIMQTLIFWRIWRSFSQIDCAGNMYLTFSRSWISQIMNKNFSPAPRARFFSTDWNSPCLLKVLHVFL